MKKILIIVALFFILSLPTYPADAQPKAVISNPVFTFETVPDGVVVSTDFIIKNMGDTLLHITRVKPP